MKIDAVYLRAHPEATVTMPLEWEQPYLVLNGEKVELSAPVQGFITFRAEDRGIRADGELTAGLKLTCSRCLKQYDFPIKTSFTAEFVPAQPGTERGDVYVIDGGEVDLEPIIIEQIMFSLPLQPLCEPGCRGLCPHCGANLNLGNCGCRVDDTDPRWDALKKLMEGKEG